MVPSRDRSVVVLHLVRDLVELRLAEGTQRQTTQARETLLPYKN